MDRELFGDMIEGKHKPIKRRTGLALLNDLLAANPKAMADFLDAIRAGASWNAAAAFLNVKPDTIQRWMVRGKSSKSGPYAKFYRQTMQALQESTIIAEAKVKERNPELWLRNGPGRWVNDQWREDGKQVDVNFEGSLVQGGKIQVQHVDIMAALKEIKAAGVPLDHLTLAATEMPDEITDNDEDDLDDDQTDTMGTNYLGSGKWRSDLPSLPELLRGKSPVIDTKTQEDTLGEITTVKPKTLEERLKNLK